MARRRRLSQLTHERSSNMKTRFTKSKYIGEIGVDAGLCWIGDPCYILHTDQPPKAIGKSWDEFCDIVLDVDKLARGDIAFGSNSWRGDRFEQSLRAAIRISSSITDLKGV